MVTTSHILKHMIHINLGDRYSTKKKIFKRINYDFTLYGLLHFLSNSEIQRLQSEGSYIFTRSHFKHKAGFLSSETFVTTQQISVIHLSQGLMHFGQHISYTISRSGKTIKTGFAPTPALLVTSYGWFKGLCNWTC